MSDVLTPFQLLSVMEQRCRAVATTLPAQAKKAQSWAGVGFRISGHYCVASMGEVTEVLHEPSYTKLPGVKPWVKGIANVRGRLLPTIDLCGYLDIETATQGGRQRRVLTVEHGDVFAGLIVDEIFGIQHFPVDSFSSEVPHLIPALHPLVQGVFLREHSWLVFSPHALATYEGFLQVAV